MTANLELTEEELSYLYYLVERDIQDFIRISTKDDTEELERMQGLLERIKEVDNDNFNT
jgi:hypothetical protein